MRNRWILNLAGSMVLTTSLFAVEARAQQQFMDYFTPTPIISPLSSTAWGAAQVGPRDQSNGLEDMTLANWDYWDGGIIKDETTGIYHMFASRWPQSLGATGWEGSPYCAHATSNNLYGPYTYQDQCSSGNCQNANVIQLKAGDTSGYEYGLSCSGGFAGSGEAYGAHSLDGPWTDLGQIQTSNNGYNPSLGYSNGSNFREILRPDGQYEGMGSEVGLAQNFLGPYENQMSQPFTVTVPNSPNTNMEDQYIYYDALSDLYHVIYHCWSTGIAYFYTSKDGITNWHLDPGPMGAMAEAYDPSTNMVRYTDGTVNHWPLLERASVYQENGHPVAMTFAATNVQKSDELGNDGNGSKVIVVPFDGIAFDCAFYDAGCGLTGEGGVDGGVADAALPGRDGSVEGGSTGSGGSSSGTGSSSGGSTSGSSSGGSTSSSSSGGPLSADASAGSPEAGNAASGGSGGCGCVVVGAGADKGTAGVVAAVLAAWMWFRRRPSRARRRAA